jgi:XRE family aerobic/anaerobic benzoate catabolism transcriptional regulator
MAAPAPAARTVSGVPRREGAASDDVLGILARRTRQLRQSRALTLQALAERSGLSRRFLMDVEAGRGNISVRRLADLAAALGIATAELLVADPAARPRVVALLGLRGAGKTTIGRRLARRLRLPFIELDQRIEARAGLALSEVFSLHGEAFYRRLERETLTDILTTGDAAVIAVGGGLVTSAETFDLLRRHATTIWLKASPADYWNRVIRQGDRRPIDQHPQAREALRQLVRQREPLYGQAEATIDTKGLTVAETVTRVERAVRSRDEPRSPSASA